jgi:hypothetical protein
VVLPATANRLQFIAARLGIAVCKSDAECFSLQFRNFGFNFVFFPGVQPKKVVMRVSDVHFTDFGAVQKEAQEYRAEMKLDTGVPVDKMLSISDEAGGGGFVIGNSVTCLLLRVVPDDNVRLDRTFGEQSSKESRHLPYSPLVFGQSSVDVAAIAKWSREEKVTLARKSAEQVCIVVMDNKRNFIARTRELELSDATLQFSTSHELYSLLRPPLDATHAGLTSSASDIEIAVLLNAAIRGVALGSVSFNLELLPVGSFLIAKTRTFIERLENNQQFTQASPTGRSHDSF